MRSKMKLMLTCGMLVFGASSAMGQVDKFPSKPITLVVPYPAGGGADSMARRLAESASKTLGQPIIIDNRSGANTLVATEYAVRRPGDGYTMLYISSSFTINPSLYKVKYSPLEDFKPVAMAAKVPIVILANGNSKITTTPELVKHLKKNPGKANYSSYGAGSAAHLIGELFKDKTGTDMLHIPYRGSAPALVDLMAGNVDFSFSSIEPAMELVRTGKAKAIAVSPAQRLKALPQTPTIAEFIPGFDATGWNAIVVPKDVPDGIVKVLADAINQAAQSEEIRSRFEAQGVEVDIRTPESMRAMFAAEVKQWDKLVKAANIRIDK